MHFDKYRRALDFLRRLCFCVAKKSEVRMCY